MESLSDSQRNLIERIGVLHDRMGMRPAAGRILGLLIVAPEGELTFDEIREALELSKSATSTSLQFLQDVGSVVYRTRPGDRKRYFRKDFEEWETRFVERGMEFLKIRFLLAEAVKGRMDANAESTAALRRMTDFLDLLAEVIRETHEDWRSNDKSRGAGTLEFPNHLSGSVP